MCVHDVVTTVIFMINNVGVDNGNSIVQKRIDASILEPDETVR